MQSSHAVYIGNNEEKLKMWDNHIISHDPDISYYQKDMLDNKIKQPSLNGEVGQPTKIRRKKRVKRDH